MNKNQIEKLKELLCYLYDNNDYYNEIMRSLSCDPHYDNVLNIYDLIPPMEKYELLENQTKILTQKLLLTDFEYDLTSGSSGDILKCYKTKLEKSQLSMNIWKRRIKFDPKVRPSNYISIFDKNFETQIGKFYNTDVGTTINLFERIGEKKPRWISGPISVFENMARLILNGYQYECNSLKVIEFMGEYVEIKKRKMIESAFHCSTINNYGAQEVWCMALECREHKLHIFEDYFYLEARMDNGNQNKSLFVTSFVNRLMPIIKYRIGDFAEIVSENCSCGCNDRCLILGGGREKDVIYGSHVLGNYFFDQIMWGVNEKYGDAVLSFQVKQTYPYHFDIFLVKGSKYTDNIQKTITTRIIKELGDKYSINYIQVDSIPYIANGKIKKFIPYA